MGAVSHKQAHGKGKGKGKEKRSIIFSKGGQDRLPQKYKVGDGVKRLECLLRFLMVYSHMRSAIMCCSSNDVLGL